MKGSLFSLIIAPRASNQLIDMVPRTGFEPVTFPLGV
jgi:hypothetical protein